MVHLNHSKKLSKNDEPSNKATTGFWTFLHQPQIPIPMCAQNSFSQRRVHNRTTHTKPSLLRNVGTTNTTKGLFHKKENIPNKWPAAAARCWPQLRCQKCINRMSPPAAWMPSDDDHGIRVTFYKLGELREVMRSPLARRRFCFACV